MMRHVATPKAVSLVLRGRPIYDEQGSADGVDGAIPSHSPAVEAETQLQPCPSFDRVFPPAHLQEVNGIQVYVTDNTSLRQGFEGLESER